MYYDIMMVLDKSFSSGPLQVEVVYSNAGEQPDLIPHQSSNAARDGPNLRAERGRETEEVAMSSSPRLIYLAAMGGSPWAKR